MPAAVAVPLIGLAVSTGMSGLQMAQANKKKKDDQDAINNFKRQDLVNPFAGLQVSTLGADRQREDLARTLASYGGLTAMGGSRGIAASLPNLLEQQNNQEAQIAANLNEQQARIDQLKGQGETFNTQLQEQRDNNDLAGLGTQLDLANASAAAAKKDLFGSIAGGLTNVMTAGFGQMEQGNGFFGQDKSLTALPQINPAGLALNLPNIDISKYYKNIQLPKF